MRRSKENREAREEYLMTNEGKSKGVEGTGWERERRRGEYRYGNRYKKGRKTDEGRERKGSSVRYIARCTE